MTSEVDKLSEKLEEAKEHANTVPRTASAEEEMGVSEMNLDESFADMAVLSMPRKKSDLRTDEPRHFMLCGIQSWPMISVISGCSWNRLVTTGSLRHHRKNEQQSGSFNSPLQAHNILHDSIFGAQVIGFVLHKKQLNQLIQHVIDERCIVDFIIL